jgi:type II secretory pathway component PulM
MTSVLHSLLVYFSRLSVREQHFVQLAGLALAAVVGYALVIVPLQEAKVRMEARIAAKEKELQEIQALCYTYLALRREVESVRSQTHQGKEFSPFSFLEGLATSTVGREKISAMSPLTRELGKGVEEQAIELRLSGVSLRELVELLYKTDSAAAPLRTTRLQIKKRYKDPYTFDVTLTAAVLNISE